MDCVEIVNMRIQNEDKLSEWSRKLLNSDKIADLKVLLFGIEYCNVCPFILIKYNFTFIKKKNNC